MKITHYLYNSFLIEWGDKKLCIDPGGLFMYYFRFTTLIPKSEWEDITHIFVTHGDPDHYWHADRIMKASGAPVIFNRSMVKGINGRNYMLGPRSKGLSFDTPVNHFHTLSVNEVITLDGMAISGIKASHGPLNLKIGPLRKTETPGPSERVGWGAIGFQINYQGKNLVNLGDTLLNLKEWADLKDVDVLMLPIGGRRNGNTMDEDEALEAVRLIKPKLAIPVHYNCPFLFSRKYNPARVNVFKDRVEKLGAKCTILEKGQAIGS